VKYLGEKKFLIGDYATYVDFYFYEMLNTLQFYTDGALFTANPTIGDYHANIRSLKGVKEYLDDPNCMEKPLTFNNKVAKLNGTCENA
jgi:hypothetical protein